MSALTCSSCGELGAEGSQWCEACGASISPGAASPPGIHAGGLGPLIGPPCVDCGADHEHIVDQYCGQCGRKQPATRDHLAEDLGPIAAVTDRGRRHHRNEDAFAIGRADDVLVGVVCDGVSTTDNPQDASLAAARSARDTLVAAITSGSTDMASALVEAVEAAQVAASAVPTIEGGQGPASTTFVATVVVPGADDVVRTWTAWLGDSRAYWVHGDTVTQLTIDDSWAVDQIGSGALTEDEALADPRAQSITRWLGADARDATPTVQAFEHDAGGLLLLSSDGLWKYAPTEVEMAELISSLEESAADVIDMAEALVAFANEQGGHDNTTVVLASEGPVTTARRGSRNDGQEPQPVGEESL